MKNKLMILGMIVLLAFMPLANVFAASSDTAVLTLTAYVGENFANSGVRISTNVAIPAGSSLFDTKFLSSATTITLANPTSDFLTNAVSGTFAVLVRRQSTTGVNIGITATPLNLGTHYAPYTLASGTLVNIVVPTTGSGTDNYDILYTGDIIRDQKVFTYNIPIDASAPLGEYSATITYTLTIL